MTAQELYEYLGTWTEEQRRAAPVTLQKGKSGSPDELVEIKVGRPRHGGFTLKLVAPSGIGGMKPFLQQQETTEHE